MTNTVMNANKKETKVTETNVCAIDYFIKWRKEKKECYKRIRMEIKL